jgi:hypothetical protein
LAPGRIFVFTFLCRCGGKRRELFPQQSDADGFPSRQVPYPVERTITKLLLMISSHGSQDPPTSDVCIVGAGPVGLAIALRLEAQGLSVTLLEMGEDETDSPQQGHVEINNRHHARAEAASRSGIGGTSALWGGRCVALDDIDFEKREHVAYSGWPIPHDELRRYYNPALEFLRCSTADLPTAELAPDDASVTISAMERWSDQPDLGPVYVERIRSSDRISIITGAAVRSAEPDASGQRIETLRARVRGRDVNVRARVFILAGGGLENGRLLLALRKSAAEGHMVPSPVTGQFYQGHLTGYVAVIQFDNAASALPLLFHRDREGRIYRRRFQISPAVQQKERLLNTVFWIDAISIADPIHGSGALSACYLFLDMSGLYRRLSKGLAPASRDAAGSRWREHLRNLIRDWTWPLDLPAVLKALARRRDRGHTLINPKGRYLLRYHAEQVPDPESKVELSSCKGNKELALAIDYKVVGQDIDSVLHSHDVLDGWLRRNGIGHLNYICGDSERRKSVLDQAFDGFHQIGLARMAADPAEGVADKNCRVHGLGNLYLAGTCLFPTSGQANPTLPAVALALRLADHLAGNLRQEAAAASPVAG